MWTPDVGEEDQRKLESASVLVSRLGGAGGTAAYYLAAAGIGKHVLGHQENVKAGDLNRQLLSNLRTMEFRKLPTVRDEQCEVSGGLS
jgi:molybdopterin/thiamine biosynthesis adenylyltransferase